MGCDFFWEATEVDIFRQRKCGWFLESLFDADEHGVSSYFPSAEWHCETFNGYYTGYFLCLDNQHKTELKKITEQTTIQLIGTTIYLFDLSEMDDMCGADAGRQFSFVFNNTSYNPPQLITIEFIRDLSKPKYERLKEYFPNTEDETSKSLKAIYRSRSYDRLITNEGWLAELLYSIKEQFLFKLEVSDDYGYFEEVSKGNYPIPPLFSESICKLELAKKWDFGYLDLLNDINEQ